MRKLFLMLGLVLLVPLGCGDTGIHGTFVPADGLGMTIQIEGKTAYLRSMGIEKVLSCEIVVMKYVETGRPFKAIRFKDNKTDQAFYAEIVEVDSSGTIQRIKVDFPFVGGIYKRKKES
jgi:hypothetical protein